MTGAVAYFVTMLHQIQDRVDGRKDRGATAVEYGLMVGLIAVAIITAVGLLGTELTTLFTTVKDELAGVGDGS